MDTNTTPIQNQANLDKPLYTIGWISGSSFLFGPLAGCYMLSKNFKNLGEENKSKNVLIFGIIFTIVLSLLFVLLPEKIINAIPNIVLPIAFGLTAQQYTKNTQGKILEDHFKNNGKKYSGWNSFGVGLLSFIIFAVILTAIIFAIPVSW